MIQPKRYIIPIKEVGAPAFDVGEPGDPDFVPGTATVLDINGELSPAERNTIKSREELEAEGAFPDPVVP